MCNAQAMLSAQLIATVMMVIITISKNESQVPCFVPEGGEK